MVSDIIRIRLLRVLSVIGVGLLVYSARDEITQNGVSVLSLLIAALCVSLLFLTWQPGGKALHRVQETLVRHWEIGLAVLAIVGLVTSLFSPSVLKSMSLDGVRTALQDRLDSEALRQFGFPLLCLLTGAVVGPEGFSRISDQSQERFRQLAARLDRLIGVLPVLKTSAARTRLVGVVGVAVLSGWLIWLYLNYQAYQYLPVNDSGFYVYIGWHTLHGGIPYQTLYYGHPPLNFALSTAWAFAGQVTGIGAINAARTHDLLCGLGLIALTYTLTRDFTRSKLAGLVAAIALVGTEGQLVTMLLGNSPSSKLSVAFLLLLCVWLTMRRRWLVAGIALALAASIWLPSASLLGMLGVVILAQRAGSKLKAFGHVALGAGAVFAVEVAALLMMGSLGSAYRQAVASAFRTVGNESSEVTTTLGQRLADYGQMLNSTWVRDDLLITGLIVLGAGLWLFSLRDQRNLRLPGKLAVPLAAFTMLGLLFMDYQGVPDIFLISCMAYPFAGAAFASFVKSFDHQPLAEAPAIRKTVVSLCLAWVLIVSLSDLPPHRGGVDLPVIESQVNTLVAGLGPGDKVQTLSANWFNVLGGVDNATPYLSFGTKYTRDVITAQGKTIESMVADMSAQDPVIVVLEDAYKPKNRSELGKWLNSRYVLQAKIPNGFSGTLVYIRSDRQDLQEIAAAMWSK